FSLVLFHSIFILLYADEKEVIKNASIAVLVIIFDDFTTGNHYVYFPFKIKSSALKILSISDQSYDEYFTFYSLNRIKYSPQNHQRHWISMFSRFKVNIPTIAEQASIGNLLRTIDNMITLHKRKNDALYDLRESYVNSFYINKNLKLKNFDKKWEVYKLSEIASYRRGSFPQPYGNPEWYDEEGMPFVQVVDVGDNFRLATTTKQHISLKAQPKSVFAPRGSVVITLQGSIGRVAITQYDAYIDRTLLIFQNYKLPINPYFLINQLHLLFEKEKQKTHGGTIKTIPINKLDEFKIYYPEKEEQEIIGKILSKFDETISLHNKKLNKLESLKKEYLNYLFI